LLTDVERLCQVYVPQWLSTPGMTAGKIGLYYDDPAKQAADASALAQAHYRRSLTVDTSPAWRARRLLQVWRRRSLDRLDRLSPNAVARLRILAGRAA
jgi:hypothetical protein